MDPRTRKSDTASNDDSNASNLAPNIGQIQRPVPVLKKGDKVHSAWWPDSDWKEEPKWYPGVVTSVIVNHEENYGYGSPRFYKIDFDDGDMLNGVEDIYVFPKDEYKLSTSCLEKVWGCIRNVCDENSKDNWARIVGYYELSVSVEGQPPQAFPLLTEALAAHKRLLSKGIKRKTQGEDKENITTTKAVSSNMYTQTAAKPLPLRSLSNTTNNATAKTTLRGSKQKKNEPVLPSIEPVSSVLTASKTSTTIQLTKDQSEGVLSHRKQRMVESPVHQQRSHL
jgi:hypothetical protein